MVGFRPMVRWSVAPYVGFLAMVTTITIASCSLDEGGVSNVTSLDASTKVDAQPTEDSGQSDAAPSLRCAASKPGPTLALAPAASGPFCIDSTEVTQAQYNEFLNTPGGIGAVVEGQTAFCRSKNPNFLPQGDAACNFDPLDSMTGNLPVTCVDYCDAFAYCQWAGKHLCGPLESQKQKDCASGGTLQASEWYAACSHDGENAYPYGPTFVAGTCNDSSRATAPSASLASCKGGYEGIFDMSGNVWEWENNCGSCTEPDADVVQCRVRGGSVGTADDLSCLGTEELNRRPVMAALPNVGFRCCDSVAQ
jgi:sulfatase modifying factor 1